MYDIKKGTKILVTGCAGFIGSNLVEKLLELDCSVIGLDDLSTGFISNIKEFLPNPDFLFIEGDIRDFDTCLKATEGVEYILHQAAWGSVPRSIEMPRLYNDINITGTLNVFEAARINDVKKVVYASSSSVYGNDKRLPKQIGNEGDVLSPYALTKKMDEEYAKMYSTVYGLKTIGLRYFNVFGKRQNPNGAYAAVIPKFVKKMMNDETPTINGNGEHSRDFTHIDNVVHANLLAMQSKNNKNFSVLNVACGGRVNLNELVEIINNSLDKDIKPKYGVNREGDILHSHANIGFSNETIGYIPITTFSEGISKTIDWYRDNE